MSDCGLMKRVQSYLITACKLTITEISQVTGKTLRPFMRPPTNLHTFKCISMYSYYLVANVSACMCIIWSMPQVPMFPNSSQQHNGSLLLRADNSQPVLQLLSQGGQVEQVTEGEVELASENKEQESDAKVSGFAKYFWSRKIFSKRCDWWLTPESFS